MDFFFAHGLKFVISLGALTALSALLIFLSCRCIPAWKPAKNWMNNHLYKRFFKTHCNLWLIFWILVVLHMIAALLYIYG